MLKNLKMLREDAGVTQKQLAEAVGVSQQSINKYENHKIEPDVDTLIAIADFFQTSVDFLIGHTDIRRRIEETHAFDLSTEEYHLLAGYRKLTQSKKDSIHQIIENYMN